MTCVFVLPPTGDRGQPQPGVRCSVHGISMFSCSAVTPPALSALHPRLFRETAADPEQEGDGRFPAREQPSEQLQELRDKGINRNCKRNSRLAKNRFSLLS